ncbi:MAG TPA: HlyD family efflux transporter periplasmic adaptor subunit [Pirellulales bacterium]|nr:HlyD family efflux transporter periplasmic adaptor subunit [Pirellulales bacterium]
MSTEQVDPQLIEQTKQQIRGLVVEIAQLAKQQVDAREFYGAFLDRVVSALAAVGGAVWTLGDAGSLELQYQINFRETRLADNQQNLQRHGMLLQKTMAGGEGLLVAPHSGEGDGDQAGNPTDFLLILGPIKVDQESKGVIEVFQRAGAPPTTQRGYLKFLLQMCELASDYLKNRQLRHFTDRQTLWNQLENFSRVAHTSLDPRETAYTIANEGRRLIECDRVSVAIRHGRHCTIEAVSGQDTFDKRSNVIALLNRLSSAVVAAGEPLWYSGDTSDLAPQVEEAVQAYVDESHSKHVAVLPLKRPEADKTDEDADEPETIGALIVEQIEDARPREGMVQRVNVVCDHSSLALANSLEHNSLFLMPVWRTLGKAKWIVAARTLPKTVAIAIAVLVVLVGMFVIPVDFSLTSDGKLQPVDRRDVFAAVEGTVDRILVRHGERVKKGQVLMEMKSTDLAVAIEDVTGKLTQAEDSLASAIHARSVHGSSSRNDEQDMKKADYDVSNFQVQVDSLRRQKKLLQQKKEKLKITSPIDGVVTTWDFDRELLTRPVKPGDALLTVANENGEWELELDVPEDRMGHITLAQKDEGPDLPVTYHLATQPGSNYEGKVLDVHESAEVHGEDGSVVLVKVQIDKEQHADLLRPGANVKARIYCGRSSVGYWLFHDAFGFLESRVLFPMNL